MEYLTSRNLKMPSSETTIWTYIENFYSEKKKEKILEIREIIKNNSRLSITVDEWSDNSFYKYINVTARSYNPEDKSFKHFNFGLDQLQIKGTAANICHLVKKRLNDFGINLDVDIVCSTHDGAAVMKKYGEEISAESQLCINHAIHLAVVDTLYVKNVNKKANEINSDNESDVEVVVENDEFYSDNEDYGGNNEHCLEIDEEYDLKASVRNIINRVRKSCKMFNKSNDKRKNSAVLYFASRKA